MGKTEKYEKFSAVFLFAGLFFLIVAFLTLGFAPATMVESLPDKMGMPIAIPVDFQAHYQSVPDYHDGLLRGRDIYVKEACWHCHSQYVRPVSNESIRYGPVSQPGEYQNKLNLPQLFGTRRVGPDLSRESGKRPNDWHYAHLYNPKWVVSQSVMPGYPWYFKTEKSEKGDMIIKPKQGAIDLVAYLQWLGHQVAQVRNDYDTDAITMPPIR